MEKLTCCIHIIDEATDDVTIRFTEHTLEKCSKLLRVRKFHGLNYSTFELPTSIHGVEGYHKKCYSRFTAIKSKYITSVPIEWSDHTVLSSESPSTSHACGIETKRNRRRTKPLTAAGVLGKICLFCGKRRMNFKRKEQQLISCSTKNFEHNIRRSAEILKDYVMISSICGSDMVAKEVHYHAVCSRRYRNKARKAEISQKYKSSWHEMREAHTAAFEVVCEFLKNHVIFGESIITITEVYKMYVEALKELIPCEKYLPRSYPPQKLENKIINYFPRDLVVDKGEKEHIFLKSTLKLPPNVRKQKITEMKRQSLLRDAAYQLRRAILSMEKKPLPQELKLSDILSGECEIPLTITEFLRDVIEGPARSSASSTRSSCKILAMGEDLIYNTTRARIKPQKHLNLGIAIKSLTNSKKVIDILNRFGHCVSYSVIEEIETELAYSAITKSQLLPDEFLPQSNLCTSVAFDNFDRYVETLTGKNTMHDTVGIVYQNLLPAGEIVSVSPTAATDDISEPTKGSKRRRCFEELVGDIEPFTKKPKRDFQISGMPSHLAGEIRDYRLCDLAWQMSIAQKIPSTPMWAGFNSKIFSDLLPCQKISYLPQINASPTSYSTVQHTLKIAQQVAQECGQHNIMCTYDLNIAKMALEIQNDLQPKFDNVFIMLGPFHIHLAYFKALGKVIDGSGISEILAEADLIAQGSLNGFVGGTHYNRCRRLYPILGVALRNLHYERFIMEKAETDAGENLDSVFEHLEKFASTQQSNEKEIIMDEYLIRHIDRYKMFEQETRQGQHGATAKFWIIVLDLIDIYHDFDRSVRMGDMDLFMKSLKSITDIFFTLNHHNYARWLVVFYDKLCTILKGPAGSEMANNVMQQLRNGFFSLRRTQKNFSRVAVDLCLEQTVNADAANKLTGVTCFKNSISARQRWAVTHSQRTAIISHVMGLVGIVKFEDVSKELRPHRIQTDNASVTRLVENIRRAINPFNETLETNLLFNISSGKAASKETAQFLFTVMENGAKLHENFRQRCAQDKMSFTKPISRNIIKNFAAECATTKLSKKGQIMEIKMERNIFGRLLALSLSNDLDMKSILEYPLTPMPLPLCHADGNIRKTQKSDLLKVLENMVNHDEPKTVDELIVDGFHFLHKLKNLPPTFDGIAKVILQKLAREKCQKIHFIFDHYITPSIKDIERRARAQGVDRHEQYHISGPKQTRPLNFIKALRNEAFKDSLVSFLISEWQSDEYTSFFQSFSLIVTHRFDCYYFQYTPNDPPRCAAASLRSSHVEADSKIAFHLSRIQQGNVVVQSADTDVLIILIGNMHLMNKKVRVWMQTGTISRNDLRYINVSSIVDELGQDMCQAMPAFHALFGSDYTACFYKIGKIKPFKHLLKSPNIQKTLAKFQEGEVVKDQEYEDIESFICGLYRNTKIKSINELRLQMFVDVYHKKGNKPFTALKGIDGAFFPPCQSVLRQKINRAKYVTLMWCNLDRPHPPTLLPENYGWVLTEGNGILVKWFQKTWKT